MSKLDDIAARSDQLLEDYERRRVPAEAQRGYFDLILIYLGVCIAIPSFLLGSVLTAGVGFEKAIGATIWGTLVSTPICLLASHVGTRTRVSTAMTLKLAFGSTGARVISAIIAVDMFCWFAVNTSISGGSMHFTAVPIIGEVLGRPVFYLFSGSLITALTIFGYRSVEKLAIVAVPLLLLLVGWYCVYAFRTYPVSEVLARPPLSEPMSYATAISIVAGTFLSISVLLPDFTRYMKGPGHAAAALVLGVTLGLPPFVIIGSYLTAATGEADFVKVMLSHGLGPAALIVVALATWTNMNGTLYSASLNLAAIFRKTPKWKLTVFAGLAGTLVALMGILERYLDFVIILSVVLPPITGVYTADYLLRRRQYASSDFQGISRFRPLALVALSAGVLAGFMTASKGELGLGLFNLTHLPAIDSYFVSFFALLGLEKLTVMSREPERATESG